MDSQKQTLDIEFANQNDLELVAKHAKQLLQLAAPLKTRLEKAFKKLTSSLPPIGDRLAEQVPSQSSLQFCHGALLFQQGKMIDRSRRGQWGFICHHCQLEVVDYSARRLSKSAQAIESGDLWVASHLVACRSLLDRRAFHRCLACYFQKKVSVDFSSASDLVRHMKLHPDYIYIQQEDVAVKELQKMVQQAISYAMVESSQESEDVVSKFPSEKLPVPDTKRSQVVDRGSALRSPATDPPTRTAPSIPLTTRTPSTTSTSTPDYDPDAYMNGYPAITPSEEDESPLTSHRRYVVPRR